jgi:hypothetical protein
MKSSSVLSIILISACTAPEPDIDPIDASIFQDGKTDSVAGVDVHSYDADAVVALANTASQDLLSHDVGLGDIVAGAIVQARAARAFVTLYDVDDAPYTGVTFFTKMLSYARGQGVGRCGDGVIQPGIETCDGGPRCKRCALETGVPLLAMPIGSSFPIDVAILPDGDVALVEQATNSFTDLRVLRRRPDGTFVGDVVISLTVSNSDPRLQVGRDGTLALLFDARDVNAAGHSYACASTDGCGFVFTFAPDGSIAAGRPTGRNPRLLSLASGDWMLLSETFLTAHVEKLDGHTLASQWHRTVAYDSTHPLGLFPSGADTCLAVANAPQGTRFWSMHCYSPTGVASTPSSLQVSPQANLASTGTGIVEVSLRGLRAVTPGTRIPSSIPFVLLPLVRWVALDDGRLVIANDRGSLAMVSASGDLLWQYPIGPRFAVGDQAIAVNTGMLGSPSFPGLTGPFPAWQAYVLVLAQ